MLNQNNLKIAAIAKKLNHDEHNPMACLYVDKQRTVATDGAALLQVTKPAVSGDEFPEIPDRAPEQVEHEYLLTRAEANDIERELKNNCKGGHGYSILSYASELTNGDGQPIKITTTDLDVFKTHTIRRIEEKYPNVDKVMPNGEPVLTIVFDAARLSRVMKLIHELKNGKKDDVSPVKISFYGDDKPAKLEATTHDESSNEQKITGLIMPLRYDKDSI